MSVNPAIPADQLVKVIPAVLPAGGTAQDLIGLILTPNTRPQIGQVLSFPTKDAVGAFFGPFSREAALASIYFLGFNGSSVKPGSILFYQYPWASAVPAWLQSGNINARGLAALQAISPGTITIDIDGTPVTSGTISLSGATSFSNAAMLINTALGVDGIEDGVAQGTIASTVFTINVVTSGQVQVGDILSGSGITGTPYITSFVTFDGTSGTVNISSAETVGLAEPITLNRPAVQYDPTLGSFFIYSGTTGISSTIGYATGALSASLLLTSVTGAQLSQGADIATPSGAMTNIINVTTNWCSFMTTFEPSDNDKAAFSAWNNSQGNKFAYICWDTNVADTMVGGPGPAPAAITLADYSGTLLLYSNPVVDTLGGEIAAFALGYAASLDFNQTNGRTSLAYKSQDGLAPEVYSGSIAQYLLSYGMNFYGDYSTANEAFVWMQNGTVTGDWRWFDSYVNQIWFTNQLQLAGMVLMQNIRNFPYNQYGYSLIEAAFTDPITAAVNFGVINVGVTLSASQIAEVNGAAGSPIASLLTQRGWYLQVKDASPTVRNARGSPPCALWYTDGEQIQQLNLSSIAVL